MKPADHTGEATDEDLAKMFNDFFSTIGIELQKEIPATTENYIPTFAQAPIFDFT